MPNRGELTGQGKIIEKLNQILEHELAGVVRYTHYSFMVFGYNRIPVGRSCRLDHVGRVRTSTHR